MYCKNCGAQIPDDSKFCKVCGSEQKTPVSYVVATPPKEPKYVSSPPPFKALKKKRHPGKITLRVFGVFCVLAGAAAALVSLTGEQTSKFQESFPAILFCWGIGTLLIGISFRKKPLPGIVPQKQANGGATLATVLGILLIVGAIGGSAANQPKTNKAKPNTKSVPMIVDATKFAGLTVEEIESLVGPLPDKGNIPIVTVTGGTVDGESYSPEGSATQFIFYEGKCVKYQYFSDKDIPYEEKKDIFTMFGISPQKDMSLVVDTNFAMRYSNVSDAIAEFHVQTMDSKKKVFSVVKVTYDGRFGGEFEADSLLKFDEKTWEDFKSLYNSHIALMNAMDSYANGNLFSVELYDACSDIEEYFINVSYSFDYGTTEDEKTYLQTYRTAALADQMAAANLKTYLDSLKTSDLSAAKNEIQRAKDAYLMIAGNRGKLLVKAGLTEEELQAKIEQDMADLESN